MKYYFGVSVLLCFVLFLARTFYCPPPLPSFIMFAPIMALWAIVVSYATALVAYLVNETTITATVMEWFRDTVFPSELLSFLFACTIALIYIRVATVAYRFLLNPIKVINLIIDINNTLMFFDPSSSKAFRDMLINLIVERTMGRVDKKGHWVQDPTGKVTYWSYLMDKYGKDKASEFRRKAFEEDQPLAGCFDEFSEPLRTILQPNKEQSAQYEGCHIDFTDPKGESVHPIIPSFLDVLNRLQKEGYTVNVKFSTFGSDLHVFKTLDAWLKGKLNTVAQNDLPTTSKISYHIAQQRFVNGQFKLSVWKIDDLESLIGQYDRLKESFEGKTFNPPFEDLACRKADAVYSGKEAITAAIASIQGHMFINNDHNYWAKSGKTRDSGKLVPSNSFRSAVLCCAVLCYAVLCCSELFCAVLFCAVPYMLPFMVNFGCDDNSLSCMPAKWNVFEAHPINVLDLNFFRDRIEMCIREVTRVARVVSVVVVVAVVYRVSCVEFAE